MVTDRPYCVPIFAPIVQRYELVDTMGIYRVLSADLFLTTDEISLCTLALRGVQTILVLTPYF